MMKKLMKKIAGSFMAVALVAAMLPASAYAAGTTFDTSITTIQNLESYVTVDNNKDGTITIHMPALSSTTVNTKSMCSLYVAQDHTLHYGYEKGSGTNMGSIGSAIATNGGWSGHTSFTESEITVDITSGEPRTAIIVSGHLATASSCPGNEAFWGLLRYTNPTKITYDLNGGNVGGSTDSKFEYLLNGEELQTTFDDPVYTDYEFDGWYTQAEGGDEVTASTGASATYYAHWIQHAHDYSDSWSKDETSHWHACVSTEGTCDTPKIDISNHVYDQEVVSEEYFKSAATYTEKETYYKSCVCGEKGTDTFTVGDVIQCKVESDAFDGEKDTVLVVKCERPDYQNLAKVYVDENLVDAANYVITEGSTVVTFTNEYAATLKVGEHKVMLEYSDGAKYDGKINVTKEVPQKAEAKAVDSQKTVSSQKTGDSSNIAMYIVLLVAGLAGVVLVLRKRVFK